MPFVLSMPVLSLAKDRSTNGGGDARELLFIGFQYSAFDKLRPNGLGGLNGMRVPHVLEVPDRLGLPNGSGLPNGLEVPKGYGVATISLSPLSLG